MRGRAPDRACVLLSQTAILPRRAGGQSPLAGITSVRMPRSLQLPLPPWSTAIGGRARPDTW